MTHSIHWTSANWFDGEHSSFLALSLPRWKLIESSKNWKINGQFECGRSGGDNGTTTTIIIVVTKWLLNTAVFHKKITARWWWIQTTSTMREWKKKKKWISTLDRELHQHHQLKWRIECRLPVECLPNKIYQFVKRDSWKLFAIEWHRDGAARVHTNTWAHAYTCITYTFSLN